MINDVVESCSLCSNSPSEEPPPGTGEAGEVCSSCFLKLLGEQPEEIVAPTLGRMAVVDLVERLLKIDRVGDLEQSLAHVIAHAVQHDGVRLDAVLARAGELSMEATLATYGALVVASGEVH